MQSAISEKRSFNAIHFDSVFKVDIFIPKAGDFSMQQLARRQLRRISPEIDQKVYVATVELDPGEIARVSRRRRCFGVAVA